MKKLLIIFSLMICFYSCGGDDSSNPSVNPDDDTDADADETGSSGDCKDAKGEGICVENYDPCEGKPIDECDEVTVSPPSNF